MNIGDFIYESTGYKVRAKKFIQSIQGAFLKLSDNPKLGRKLKIASAYFGCDINRFTYKGYVLIYISQASTIRLLRVFGPGQNYQDEFED